MNPVFPCHFPRSKICLQQTVKSSYVIYGLVKENQKLEFIILYSLSIKKNDGYKRIAYKLQKEEKRQPISRVVPASHGKCLLDSVVR